jgi:hypothetical protein
MKDPNQPAQDPNQHVNASGGLSAKEPPPTFTPMIIWGALLMSQLMYVMVALQVSNRVNPNAAATTADPGVLKFPLSLAALAAFTAAIFIPRILLKSSANRLNTDNAPLKDLMKAFMPPFIVRLALFEGVTLLGFVLVIAGREPLITMLPFLGASMIGFILNFPNEAKVRNMLKINGPEQI